MTKIQYAEYRNFEANIMKEQLGQTTRYGGNWHDALKTGLAHRMPSLRRIKLQSTQKTWRACRTCRATRAVANIHINDMVSLQKCPTCKGKGMVFG